MLFEISYWKLANLLELAVHVYKVTKTEKWKYSLANSTSCNNGSGNSLVK
jgi:hypothetical protein